MSRKGNCWANTVSESFFHTLKTELTHHQTYVSREDAKPAVFEYIGVFYNCERLHSANGYQSPVDFEWPHKAAYPCVRNSVDTSDLECAQIQTLSCLVLKNCFIQQQQRDVQS